MKPRNEVLILIINILGGGPEEELPNLKQYDGKDCLWLGVDRGVFTLLSLGITPDYAFGDFDSVSQIEWEIIENKVVNLHKYKPEKDETDMELALNWALTKEPTKIQMFGATGGRLDHFLGNVQMLLKAELQQLSTHIEIIDRQNQLYVKGPGCHQIERLPEKKYISFIPVTPDVKGLSLEGFKYSLSNRHISLGSTLCISNELLSSSGTFSITEGILMVVRSSD
jgi:thiamine pyrophosphokinase